MNPLGQIDFEKHGRKTLLWNISSGNTVLYFLLNVISGLNIGIMMVFFYFCLMFFSFFCFCLSGAEELQLRNLLEQICVE